jgi:hypothetical protein
MDKRFAIAAFWISAGCYSGVDHAAVDTEGSASSPSGGEGEGETESEGSGGETEGSEVGPDPGRVTLHRLNRVEYNNTIRDLFWGLDIAPADQFPSDDHSFGFDNIADTLNVTPLLFELYERAAENTLDAAFAAVGGGEGQHVEAEDVGGSVGSASGAFWNLTSDGEIATTIDIGTAGAHEIRVLAAGQQGGPDLPHMVVTLDGLEVGAFDVSATSDAPAEYVVEAELDAGAHALAVSFTNDYYDEPTGADRNLLVDWIDVVPLDGGGGGGDIRANILVCEPEAGAEDACNRDIIETFAERAWRRPVTAAEVDALAVFVDHGVAEGGTWEDGIKLALKAVLVSPHFIYRVEIDPEPESTVAHPLSDYELASRLSYFLWSSMPDDALFDAARAGDLSDPDAIEEQVRRMVQSPKAQALVANFAGQWLYTRALGSDLVKDYQTYPEWDEDLRDAMRQEMELFIGTFVTEGRSLTELLTSKRTFVNDRLATHYGLPAVGGEQFVEVSLDGQPRKGLLTTAGLMAVLSHPNVTSPVKRGKWVLEQLLCIEPPPPPADVETTVDPSFDEGPMRERLEQHREDPSCAACHALMDPVGLALENYDGVGVWREMEGPWPIDASGELPPPVGGTFDDALQMVEHIANSEQFAECTTEKALIYGLGRGLESEDDIFLEEITAKFIEGGLRLEDLLVEITISDVFRMRRGEPQE